MYVICWCVLVFLLHYCCGTCNYENNPPIKAYCTEFTDFSISQPTLREAEFSETPSLYENSNTLSTSTLATLSSLTKITISRLLYNIEPGAFLSLPSVFHIYLANNKLNKINANTFVNTTAVTIDLNSCNIKEIDPGAFSGANRLAFLNLWYNDVRTIRRGVFSHLPALEFLNLWSNGIETIEEKAFEDLPSLNKLKIPHNRLTTFDPNRLLTNGPRIKFLSLFDNLLEIVTPEMFTNLPNLVTLSLTENRINTILANSFSSLTNLEELYLARNRLTEIKLNVFPRSRLTKLKTFNVASNKLSYLSTIILNRLPALQQMAIIGNPWQCKCLEVLLKYQTGRNISNFCKVDYFDGTLPICLVPDSHSDSCLYDSDVSEELYNVYDENIGSYRDQKVTCLDGDGWQI